MVSSPSSEDVAEEEVASSQSLSSPELAPAGKAAFKDDYGEDDGYAYSSSSMPYTFRFLSWRPKLRTG